jgi:hypothetical protein
VRIYRRKNRISNNNKCVRFLFDELHRQRCTEIDFSERTGIYRGTLRNWRTCSNPRVNDLDFALNMLGYEIVVRPIKHE